MALALALTLCLPICSYAEDSTPTSEVDESADVKQTVDGESRGKADFTDEESVGENVQKEQIGGENSPNQPQNDAEADEITNDGGESPPESPENSTQGGNSNDNLFEDIYLALEQNADKIFSILAFIGTLIVGFGYKSGLLPMIREMLTKLKSSIDGVKADGEECKARNEEKFAEIGSTLHDLDQVLQGMRWQREDYEMLLRERESMRILLQGQIDMLYAIFMTSALPQYQKDEIGERISEMKEELRKYESIEEN